MCILLACQWLHTHTATEPQSDRIHRGQPPLQLVVIVAELRLEYYQDVDVTVGPSLAPGLGSEQHHGVQPMAVG